MDNKINMSPLIDRGLYLTGREISWDNVPGVHTKLLLESLTRYHLVHISWVLRDDVKVVKIGNSITVFNETADSNTNHELTLTLKEDKSMVTVVSDNGNVLEFPTRISGNKVFLQGVTRASWTAPAPRLKDINRLLYWDNLILFDYGTTPLHSNRDEEELLRNITLSANIGKIVKRYSDCITSIPHAFRKAEAEIAAKEKYKDMYIYRDEVEELQEYRVHKVTKIVYSVELNTQQAVTTDKLHGAFKKYLASPLRSDQVDRDKMAFKFTPQGTNYEISLLFSGKISKIKVVPPDEREPTVDEIIEMSDWANRELADVVDRAAICKKIESCYESDMVSEIVTVCDL